MKKLNLLLMLLLVSAFSFAQSLSGMSYQAVLRDSGGALLVSQSVGMQISILSQSSQGTAVYREKQNPVTNVNGLVSLVIGGGSTTDDFADIDWSLGRHFIKIETDPLGGSNYSITGTSQLMSVPYALQSKKADNGLTTQQAADITTNNVKISYPGDQDISGIAINTSSITTLKSEQTIQIESIALNTAKTGIVAKQASDIATNNVKISYPGDQDISRIAINTSSITTLKSEQTIQSESIALNTAKTSIVAKQASDIITNNEKISYPGDQDISGIAVNTAGITTLKSEQTIQNEFIEQNTAKITYPGDQDLTSYATKAYVASLEAKLEALKSIVYKNTPAANLLADGVPVLDLLTVGVSISDLVAGGAAIVDLVAAGATVKDLKAANIDDYEIIAAGGSLLEYLELGYNSSILHTTYSVPILDLYLHGIPFTTMIADGVLLEALTKGTALPDLLKAGATVLDLLAVGITNTQLVNAGATTSNLLAAGSSVSDLLAAGVSIEQLVNAGVTVVELVDAGANHIKLQQSGFSIATLIESGLSVNVYLGMVDRDNKYRRFTISDFLAQGAVSYEILIKSNLTAQQAIDVSIQNRLLKGERPIEIYDSDNSLLQSIYGKSYSGGYIAYLEVGTENQYEQYYQYGKGFVVANYQRSIYPSCAPPFSDGGERVRTARDNEHQMEESIHNGLALTTQLAALCPGEVNCATICRNLRDGGFDDWFLPPVDILLFINRNYLNNEEITNVARLSRSYQFNSTSRRAYEWDSYFFDWNRYNNGTYGDGFWPVRAF